MYSVYGLRGVCDQVVRVASGTHDAYDVPMTTMYNYNMWQALEGRLFSRKKMRLAFGGFEGMLSGRSGSGCNFMPFFNFLILGGGE